MLRRGEVSTLDLISAHDQSENGELDQDEFIRMMHSIVADEYAWNEGGARLASMQAFTHIAGDDEQVDIEELEGWFIRGRVEQRKRRHSTEDASKTPVDALRTKSPCEARPECLASSNANRLEMDGEESLTKGEPEIEAERRRPHGGRD